MPNTYKHLARSPTFPPLHRDTQLSVGSIAYKKYNKVYSLFNEIKILSQYFIRDMQSHPLVALFIAPMSFPCGLFGRSINVKVGALRST